MVCICANGEVGGGGSECTMGVGGEVKSSNPGPPNQMWSVRDIIFRALVDDSSRVQLAHTK